jgi:TRAP-type C4-dicarboxylate transport system permease small subunit
MMHWLNRIDRSIAKAEKLVVVVLLSLMILVAFVQIALRNFWATGLTWGDPFVRYMVLWVGFIGAALATHQGKHIKIDVLSHWLPPRANDVLQSLLNLVSAGICGLLALSAARFVRFEAQLGGTTFLTLPTWIPQIIIPVAFGIMALRFVLAAVTSLARPGHPPTSSGNAGLS